MLKEKLFSLAKSIIPRRYHRLIYGRYFSNSPLLSVIVPMYKVENYIESALESIVQQTYRNLQIIVVDDGSPDRSYEYARRIKRKDARVQIVRKSNGGLGSARNYGLRYVNGTYVAFADSDDTLPKHSYSTLIASLEETQSDFAVGKLQRRSGNKTWVPKWSQEAHNCDRHSINITDHPDMLLDIFACNKIFRVNFFKQYIKQFPENIRYEDQVPSVCAYLGATKFDVLSAITYTWITRDDGSSISQQKHNINDIRDRLTVMRQGLELIQSSKNDLIIDRYLEKLFGFDLWAYYDPICRNNSAYWGTAVNGVKELLKIAKKDPLPYIHPIDRIFIQLMYTGTHEDFIRFATYVDVYKRDYKIVNDKSRVFASIPYASRYLPKKFNKSILELTTGFTSPVESRLYSANISNGILTIIGSIWVPGIDTEDIISQFTMIEINTGHVFHPSKAQTNVPIIRWHKIQHSYVNYAFSGFKIIVDLKQNTDKELSQINKTYAIFAQIHAERQNINKSFFLGRIHSSSPLAYPCISDNEKNINYILTNDVVDICSKKSSAILIKELEHTPTSSLSRKRMSSRCCTIHSIHYDRDCLIIEGIYQAPEARHDAEIFFESTSGQADILAASTSWDADRFKCVFRFSGGRTALPNNKAILKFRYKTPSGHIKKFWSNVSSNVNQALPITISRSRNAFKLTRTPKAGALHIHVAQSESALHETRFHLFSRRQKYQYLLKNLPVSLNTFLFESFGGIRCDDSPLAMSDWISKNIPDAKIYWSISDHSIAAPNYATPLIRETSSWYEILATAKYLINNNNFPYGFKKNRGQIYIQTWHGTPLKRIGNDVPSSNLSLRYRDLMKDEVNYWDFLIAQNTFSANKLTTAFNYKNEVLCVGYPRNDQLLSTSDKRTKLIKNQLGISEKDRVLLYAPTWRDTAKLQQGGYRFKSYLDIEEIIGHAEDIILLVRGHPNTIRSNRIPDTDRVKDVRFYPVLTELFTISDFLITDYSSLMFDYAVTRKPIIYLVPDLDEYSANIRGIYLNLREIAPGPLCEGTAEIINYIDNINLIKKFDERYKLFTHRFCSLDDGQATARAWKHILFHS